MGKKGNLHRDLNNKLKINMEMNEALSVKHQGNVFNLCFYEKGFYEILHDFPK